MEYSNFAKVCRTCLSQSETLETIVDVQFSKENSVKLIDFIGQITRLKISEWDQLPNKICLSCINSVYKIYEFVQMCILNDIKLQSIETEIHIEKFSDPNDSNQNATHTYENSPEENEEIECSESEIIKSNDTSCEQNYEEKHNIEQIDEIKVNEHKCKGYDKSFTTKNKLKIHKKCHNHDENFICQICGQKFRYLYLLQRHSYKHQEEKPYPCEFCGRGCLTLESLRRHKKIHDKNYVKKTHTCSICFKEFPYHSSLQEHIKNHSGEKPFLCTICGKAFRQNGSLKYHMRSHNGIRPYKCEICGENFAIPGVLKVHMKRHSDDRPYICDICSMAFKQASDLKGHRKIHTGHKNILCTICGKKMSTTGQLTIHVRSHTGERPYACGVCSKAFTTKNILIKHERIHTGVRPYVCKMCGKGFKQSGTLKKHMKTHTPKGDINQALIIENMIKGSQLSTGNYNNLLVLPN